MACNPRRGRFKPRSLRRCVVLADAYALRLRAFARRCSNELHRRVHLQVLEGRMDHVLAAEVELAAVARLDDPDAFFGTDPCNPASLWNLVALDVAALFTHDLLESTRSRSEPITQRYVDVLVVVPIGDDLGVSGHADVDLHLEPAALLHFGMTAVKFALEKSLSRARRGLKRRVAISRNTVPTL